MTCEIRRDSTPVTERQPARGYTWPPFEKGNLVAVRHGAFSNQLVGEKASRVRELLLERYPYLADEAFVVALERYCRAEPRAVMLHDYVMEKAETEGVEAVPAYLWAEARGADGNAARFGQDCGLDPTGHARIARDLGLAQTVRRHQAALAVERLKAEGSRLAELREVRTNG